MNKELKVGDIVIFAEGNRLDNMETILAKENHLFEVESLWGKDAVDLKSISTGFKTGAYIEDVRHATLKEKFLRDGYSVVINNIGYLVSGNILIGQKGGLTTEYFRDDLSRIPNRGSITKVFYNPSEKFEDKIDKNHELTIVLWENKPKIQLTAEEVVILKNINKKYKYIARDNDKTLCVYGKEPEINESIYVVSHDNEPWEYLNTFKHLFQDITFESGAHLISDLIKGNEKMEEEVIDTYYWLGHLNNYEVKGFIYNEDTEVLTLYTYTDDERDIKTIVDLSYAYSPIQLETFTDEEINEHLLETYEEYVHHEDLVSMLKENK